jgi:uncharacterized protein
MKRLVPVIFSVALLACPLSLAAQETPVGLANPASVFCAACGGDVAIIPTDAGETGYCALPSGLIVEEWTLYNWFLSLFGVSGG